MRHKILAAALGLAALLWLAEAAHLALALAGFALLIYGVVAVLRFARNLDVNEGSASSGFGSDGRSDSGEFLNWSGSLTEPQEQDGERVADACVDDDTREGPGQDDGRRSDSSSSSDSSSESDSDSDSDSDSSSSND
ncbi:hypothetical protein OOT46_07600 [Aquabacterium sp. A7-Y]|uniref:hypothetical protein n=1 Tax=Aquabacterium sp. A7-Y TaxID=1349605 RepID=UPI00223CB1E0|nr:hypothetical protein [Aquabacterium sp. A7-Y]MCW7537714.1 hypothetical protein [Aquabacterium sp. A7-Y]